MENLIISLNVVLPLAITMILGYLLKKYRFYNDETLKNFNNLVFRIFLPLHLFNSIYKSGVQEDFDIKFITFSILSVVGLVAISTLIIPLLEKENRKRGVLVQGLFRSNFVIMGLPVAMSVYGESKMGTVAILVAIIVPLYNILAVITLEMFKNKKLNFFKTVKKVIKNPLIIGAALGILFLTLEIELPKAIKITINDLAKVATPLAIFLLGGSFKFKSVAEHKKHTLWIAFFKLIAIPSFFVSLGIFLGFKEIQILMLYIMFGAPVAVSSFTMAEQMDGDSDLAGQIVVFTTIFSVISIFVGVFAMKTLNFI